MVEFGTSPGMVKFHAGWELMNLVAELGIDSTKLGIASDVLYGSSLKSSETYVWVVMSEEQQERLKSSSVRKNLRRLTGTMFEQMVEPLQALGLNRPFVSIVREDRVSSLNKWAAKKDAVIA